jgi:hypothetical protein
MDAVHWSAEMRRMVPEQPGIGELSPGVLGMAPLQPPESHASVQVFTFVDGFNSSMVMLWNGRSLLLMAA